MLLFCRPRTLKALSWRMWPPTGTNGGQMINWQRCWGDLEVAPAYGEEGTGRDDDALEAGMESGDNRIKQRKRAADRSRPPFCCFKDRASRR